MIAQGREPESHHAIQLAHLHRLAGFTREKPSRVLLLGVHIASRFRIRTDLSHMQAV